MFDGPVLVTGATGFLGSHLVRKLISLGQPVIATGRSIKVGLDLQAEGADFRPVDLKDRDGLVAAMKGVAAVVHSGALSTAWGKRSDFVETNVRGTENVIAACLKQGVKRLIYISSPSVMTRHADQLNLSESDPLPDTHVSVYSETKRVGEDRVRAASDRIETIILRPKGIYGLGDSAIFPRLIKSAAKGRLPIVGDGQTVTNLTHVSDVVEGIVLALESMTAVGGTYVLTGGEDIKIWDAISDVVVKAGHKAPKRTLALKRAMRAAGVLEWVWGTLRLPGEPPITRYTAGILGHSQTYDITAAKRDLGYEPRMSLARGIDETFRAATATPAPKLPSATKAAKGTGPKPPAIGVHILSTGKVWARAWYFHPLGGGLRWVEAPALFAVLEHPEQGLILFDTGYAPRFYDATKRLPWRVMRFTTPTQIQAEDSAVAQLERLGYRPQDVTQIILSHFDPDHFGGLMDFPGVRVTCSWRAWQEARGLKGRKAFKARILPGHLPSDLAGRLHLLPDPDGPPISVFDHSLDLIGDRSIRLVELPGHAPGQLGAFVRRKSDGADVFLAADAVWNLAAIEANGYRGGAHRWFAVDKKSHDETYSRLRRLHAEWPELIIVPAHCPRTWREQGERRETLGV